MLSIIVPVYNCGEYINKCVQSVLEQTVTDLELILVDDGSFDGSGELCDLWAQSDSRVKVIHQANAGVSAARNAGLEAAMGEYIGFVDADDYIAPRMYEMAMEAMSDADICMFDTVTVFAAGTAKDTIPLLEESCLLEKKDWEPPLLAQMAGSACRCLYRRALVQEIRFPVGIKLSEDRLFNLEAMGRAEKLYYLKKGMYFRTVREGSACNRYHGDRFQQNLLAMGAAEKILREYWGESYLPTYMRAFVIGGALSAVYEISSRAFPGKRRLAAVKEVTDHPALESAFALCPPEGLREKLLAKKANAALLAVGVAWNLKNGR